MTDMTHVPGGASRRPVKSFLALWRSRAAQWRTYNQTVRELNALTDRDLSDIGLSRSMIPDVARETAHLMPMHG
jgi:uncharacterized protein YjiS (DUF1127 family)